MPDDLAEKVGVVLLTHECGHRLTRVLAEVTRLGLPVVAVDNGSTDDTVEVLAGHGIRTVRLDRNIGAAGRNVGAELLTTPYVAFCDDDGWYERDGVRLAADLLDRHPVLALVNARILVEPGGTLDPISAEMAASPLPDRHGLPGTVLLGFMAGASIFRRSAFLEVGGYDREFFIGGEEETLAMKLARAGWQMRYVPEIVAHHRPSVANAPRLRPYGMRNTLWNAWLHRRLPSALRWTAFTLADAPKNGDWAKGLAMALRGMPGVLRRRRPMPRPLDRDYARLDERRFRTRRKLLNTVDPLKRRQPSTSTTSGR